MKKILTPVFLLLLLASCNGKQKEGSAQAVDKPVINDLPKMQITFLDGTKTQASNLNGNTILVMFFPDCEHCQEEAKAMEENLASFDKYTVYYLSAAAQPEIEKFATDYKLAGKSNIKFGMVSGESVVNNFGPIPTPSIYIYNEDRRMIKKFEGQTDIQVIISAL